MSGRHGLTAADYARYSVDELQRRLKDCRERMARADTTEAALDDAYCEQELCAALAEKTGHSSWSF